MPLLLLHSYNNAAHILFTLKGGLVGEQDRQVQSRDESRKTMSTDIGGRAVLRPAGNVTRSNLRKTSKPPPSPVKPPLKPPAKISPPNSLPSTPSPLSRTPPLKPNSASSKRSPHKTPSSSSVSLHPHHHQEPLSLTPLDLANDGPKPAATVGDLPPEVSGLSFHRLDASGCEHEADGSTPALHVCDKAMTSGSELSRTGSCSRSNSKPPSNENSLSVKGASKFSALGKKQQNGTRSSADAPNSYDSKIQTIANPRIALNKSTSEVFRRSSACGKVKNQSSNKKSLNKLGSLSFDESSLASIIAAKKAAAKLLNEQRKQKVMEYGRKPGKASRVAPEGSSSQISHLPEQQRCRFISAQSDPVFVDYHDKEWGVPVHEDRVLFELLTLAGFQAELNWTTILHKRDAFRTIFVGFDPAAVSLLSGKHIVSLEADKSLGLPGGKVQGVVNNARKILEVTIEFGSLDEYLWEFVNRQPMINKYRYPKQVPVKTSKAEVISKDLVKRGFRFVGPTTIYSFMQASGMTNDHLVHCFRHQECTELPGSFGALPAGELPDGTTQGLASTMQDLNLNVEDSSEHEDRKNEYHSEQQEECMQEIGLEEEGGQRGIVK